MEFALIPWRWWVLLGLVVSSLPLPLLNKISAGKNTAVKGKIAGVWGAVFVTFLIFYLVVFSKFETYWGVGKLLALMAVLNGIGCFGVWAIRNWREEHESGTYDGRHLFRGIGIWVLIVIYPLIAGSVANRRYFKEMLTELNQRTEEGYQILLPYSVRECHPDGRKTWIFKCRWREEEFRAEGGLAVGPKLKEFRKHGFRRMSKWHLLKARVSGPNRQFGEKFCCVGNLTFVYTKE